MALPVEFNKVTVFGTYLELDGDPVVGYLTFKPSPVIIKAMVSKSIIVPVVLQADLDVDGNFSIDLPATDDPDINPADWTYEVTEGFGPRRVYSISVSVADAPSVNIFDKVPLPIANGTFYLGGPTGPAGPPAIITSGQPAPGVGNAGSYAIDPATGILYHRVTTTWDTGVHLAAADIAIHEADTSVHGVTTVVGTTEAQTLSNKTIVAPILTGTATGAALTLTGNLAVGGNLTLTGDMLADDVTGDQASFSDVTVANTPSASGHAVRKDYADALGTPNATNNTIVRRDVSGGSNFTWLFVDAVPATNGAPTLAAHLTRKDYVDSVRRITSTALPAAGAAYTLALADEGKRLYSQDATNTTVTVPTNASVAFPLGSWIEFQNVGGGSVTLAGAGGVTLSAPDGNFTTRTTRSTLRLSKTGTDTWTISGDNNDTIAQQVTAGTASNTASALVRRSTGNAFAVSAITGLGTPTTSDNAANKGYTDGLFNAPPTTRKVPVMWGSYATAAALPTLTDLPNLLAGDTIRHADYGFLSWDGSAWEPWGPKGLVGMGVGATTFTTSSTTFQRMTGNISTTCGLKAGRVYRARFVCDITIDGAGIGGVTLVCINDAAATPDTVNQVCVNGGAPVSTSFNIRSVTEGMFRVGTSKNHLLTVWYRRAAVGTAANVNFIASGASSNNNYHLSVEDMGSYAYLTANTAANLAVPPLFSI